MQRSRISLVVNGISIIGETYFPEDDGGQFPALCICHGIPSGKPAIPTDGGYPQLAERFCQAGFATVIFNFRGTGVSGGNFDMMGWAKDLGAVIDYMWSLRQVDRSRFCLMGFSGGAAVSTYVAANDSRVSRVVLCACPAEFRGLIEEEDVNWEVQEEGVTRTYEVKDFSPDGLECTLGMVQQGGKVLAKDRRTGEVEEWFSDTLTIMRMRYDLDDQRWKMAEMIEIIELGQ